MVMIIAPKRSDQTSSVLDCDCILYESDNPHDCISDFNPHDCISDFNPHDCIFYFNPMPGDLGL